MKILSGNLERSALRAGLGQLPGRTAATALVQELLAGWDLASHQRMEDRRHLLEEQRAMLLGGSIAEGLTA